MCAESTGTNAFFQNEEDSACNRINQKYGRHVKVIKKFEIVTHILNIDNIMWVNASIKSINQALNKVVEVTRIITNSKGMDLTIKHQSVRNKSSFMTTNHYCNDMIYFCLQITPSWSQRKTSDCSPTAS